MRLKKRGEYRFFHAPFKAKLWIFENNRKQQYSILELEDKSILVNFDLGEKLGFRYENYPLLHLNEQISAQIKCDSSNSPILSNAKYRNRRNLDLISEEFTMLLYEWINDGYMKPLFPPISDNVITEWNKKIFHNFVTYGKSLLKKDNFKELWITWLVTPETPTIDENLIKIFQEWLEILAKPQQKIGKELRVRRIILYNGGELRTNVKYRKQFEKIVKENILNDIQNPNYKFAIVDISLPNFDRDVQKDFTIFFFEDSIPIFQGSTLDLNNKLLRLYFKPVNKESEEFEMYKALFENKDIIFREANNREQISEALKEVT